MTDSAPSPTPPVPSFPPPPAPKFRLHIITAVVMGLALLGQLGSAYLFMKQTGSLPKAIAHAIGGLFAVVLLGYGAGWLCCYLCRSSFAGNLASCLLLLASNCGNLEQAGREAKRQNKAPAPAAVRPSSIQAINKARARTTGMQSDPDYVESVFEQMQAQGWDTARPLKWGHFFVHSSIEPLRQLAEALAAEGHRFESCHQADNGVFVLQVSKTEVRRPEDLHRQNEAFTRLAAQRGIDLYDGWDVGRPDRP